MQTIDATQRMSPTSWTDLAEMLGTSPANLNLSRKALGVADQPLSPELIERLRQITVFCQRRSTGGGAACTRRNFVQHELDGTLNERLKQLGIIGEQEP